MGEDGVDTDLPTRLELLLLNNVAGKTFFWYVFRPASLMPTLWFPNSTFQILFYALRPGFVRTQTPTRWHAVNIAVQLIFDYALYKFAGIKPLIYLLMSSFFAGSLHPCAGHFIAEHYLWDGLEQETYSYYGPLNVLAYNVRLPCFNALRTDPEHAPDRWATITSIMTSPPSPGRAYRRSKLLLQSSTRRCRHIPAGQ